jgi:beta-glucosidase
MTNTSECSTPSALPVRITGVLALLLAISASLCGRAQAPAAQSAAIEAKAHELLSKLTLEQKILLIGGVDSMFTNAIPSINLPRFKMSDASVGVRTWGPTTAYAGGVALAATWDKDFARQLGESLGRDARARNVNFLLGPGVNIARSPICGRNFEYLSEDPYLNSALVVPYIQGVQSQGVIATVKHYAANNQEYSRHDTDSIVDERTLREIYLPAFEAAVTRGRVDSVMNSYNLINGVHATQNDFLNLKVLKGEWGFQGILMSDWDATYDGVAAANNGLDLEMPSPRFMNAKTLLPAVKSGQVKESTIDDKVLRLLRTELRYGFTDRPQFDPSNSTDSMADRAVALQGARESITLLKNEHGLLPLDAAKIKTIAIIGPDAWPAVPGGGGSSEATPFAAVSMVDGIAGLVEPNVHVLYTRGLPEMNEVFWSTHWDGPVKLEAYANKDFSGTPETTTKNTVSDWDGNMWWVPGDPKQRSVRYTASYKAGKAGKCLLLMAVSNQDAIKLTVDGKEMPIPPHAEGLAPRSWTLDLTAGQTVRVQADYLPYAPGVHLSLGLSNEADLISAEAKQYAAMADVAIVAVGYNPGTESEGIDRTFALPWGQDALIEAVAQANPRTIVTLTAGGAVDTRRWLDKASALLDNYYPGQEGGSAIADVLFGKQNPEGKLPVTFDRAWEDNPSYPYYYPTSGADTKLHVPESDRPATELTIGHVKYEDKLMVGYRYWTSTGKHPLYPFGYGLSYTSFDFSNLKTPATASSGSEVTVSFDVTNTGKRDGAEVAQLYVADPSAKVKRPLLELKGFEKVRLSAGETKHVSITLDARAFSYWDEGAHKWTIDPGKFSILVGNSSENTPLHAEVTLN